MKRWQKWATGLGAGVLVYTWGVRDGENPAPAGQPPESVQELEKGKTALLGGINQVTGFGQGVFAEGGELLQTGGAAAAGAGGAAAGTGNTVPGAPPK